MRHGRVCTKLRILLLPLALTMAAGAVSGLGACGGSSKSEAQEPGQDEPDDTEDQGATMVSAEELDRVKTFFDRKNQFVTRCFLEAKDAGEIPREVREARITIQLTITKAGKPTNITYPESTVKSAVLEDCIRNHVNRWTLPTLSQNMDYSHSFGFAEL